MGFFPSDVKGWLDLGAKAISVVDDIQSRGRARDTGRAASRVAGASPGFGIQATEQAFDAFGRPVGPDLEFQGFSAEDLASMEEAEFAAVQTQVQNIADARRQEVLQNAEAMGLPSGLIAQQNALIDKWEQETLLASRADIRNKAAGLLQEQYGQQNLFGLELYDREQASALLPFELALRYSGDYGNQALQGGQLDLYGQQLGGEFFGSAMEGAAGLIGSLGGDGDGVRDPRINHNFGIPNSYTGISSDERATLDVLIPGSGTLIRGLAGERRPNEKFFDYYDRMDPAVDVYDGRGDSDRGRARSVSTGERIAGSTRRGSTKSYDRTDYDD